MIAGILGDINGNFPALQAAISALDAAGIQTILHVGNIAVGATGGTPAIALLRAHGVPCVQGYLDRQAARSPKKRLTCRGIEDAQRVFIAEAQEQLPSTDLEYLRALPRRRRLDIDGVSILLCYGSPASQSRVLAADTPLMKLERQREIEPADVVVYGGAPQAFSRMAGGTLFIAPGPLEVEHGIGQYVLLSTEETPWTTTVCRAPYEPEE